MPPDPTVKLGVPLKIILPVEVPAALPLPEASNKAGVAATAEVLVVTTF